MLASMPFPNKFNRVTCATANGRAVRILPQVATSIKDFAAVLPSCDPTESTSSRQKRKGIVLETKILFQPRECYMFGTSSATKSTWRIIRSQTSRGGESSAFVTGFRKVALKSKLLSGRTLVIRYFFFYVIESSSVTSGSIQLYGHYV